jgi:hypothetical protein
MESIIKEQHRIVNSIYQPYSQPSQIKLFSPAKGRCPAKNVVHETITQAAKQKNTNHEAMGRGVPTGSSHKQIQYNSTSHIN